MLVPILFQGTKIPITVNVLVTLNLKQNLLTNKHETILVIYLPACHACFSPHHFKYNKWLQRHK